VRADRQQPRKNAPVCLTHDMASASCKANLSVGAPCLARRAGIEQIWLAAQRRRLRYITMMCMLSGSRALDAGPATTSLTPAPPMPSLSTDMGALARRASDQGPAPWKASTTTQLRLGNAHTPDLLEVWAARSSSDACWACAVSSHAASRARCQKVSQSVSSLVLRGCAGVVVCASIRTHHHRIALDSSGARQPAARPPEGRLNPAGIAPR
jgi:hypothetical protein